MERSFSRTTRWFALATLIGPVSICYAEPATSVESATQPAVEAVTETVVTQPTESVATAPAVIAPVDLKNAPLFKHTSYPAAWTAAQETNRPILVYVSMPQCPHCSKMLEESYGKADISDMVKSSFETVQASRYTHAALISKLHVRWYPTTVIVGSNNKVLDVIEGYVDANSFKQRLQLGIASAHSDTQTR